MIQKLSSTPLIQLDCGCYKEMIEERGIWGENTYPPPASRCPNQGFSRSLTVALLVLILPLTEKHRHISRERPGKWLEMDLSS